MRVLLFTVINCIACDKHRKDVMKITAELNVSLNIYNIDDPRYLHMSLKGMQLYGVRKTPSLVILNLNGEMISKIEGIANSIERLKNKIDEERNN